MHKDFPFRWDDERDDPARFIMTPFVKKGDYPIVDLTKPS